jgi:hypothetical protein
MDGSPQRHLGQRPERRREVTPARRRATSDRESRRRERARAGRRHLLVAAGALCLLTWIPGATGLGPLGSWGVLSGYTGLSWAVPGVLVGLAAASASRDRNLPLYRPVGVAAGLVAAALFLLAAAEFVGT